MTENRLDHLLADSAAQRPGHTAVVHPGVGQATYAELATLSGELAARLAAAGVRANDRVGICAPKSIGTVAAIFASLASDACHVPVDPGAPAQRSAYIFSDCGVRAVLVHQPLIAGLEAELSKLGVVVARSEPVATPDYAGVELTLLVLEADQALPAEVADENLAYILYTSGSTGKPKGVIHSHATALGFIDWCSAEFQPGGEDRFSSHAPFHFDLSIFDLYVSIKHGATLVLIGEEEGKQPMGLASLIEQEGITVWYSTPSILRLLVEYGKLETLDCSGLRLVLYAGEVFPLKHLQSLYQQLPHPQYYNLYGPTETNVCTYHHVPTPIPNDETLPGQIGSVCSGDRARVVGEDGVDVPPGSEGELWIAGDSVHLGYWNLPEKNREVFDRDSEGNQWYKTGDLVVQRPAGDFLFMGRRDRMVKRRGFRVELGEIETTLYQHPEVAEAAVVALPDENSGVQLRAFVQWGGEAAPSVLVMKRYASENLLNYMVPDRFVFLDDLPKTSTDKIDYQRLKEL